jgi:hypothetical protein
MCGQGTGKRQVQMGKSKTKFISDPSVECPFCKEKVKAKLLADHAKQAHGNDPKFAKKPTMARKHLLEGIEVQNPNLVQNLNQLVVDESGMLINPHLLDEEHHKSRDERMGTAPLPKSATAGQNNKSGKVGNKIRSPEGKQSNSMDKAFQQKAEWLHKTLNQVDKVNSFKGPKFIKCSYCGAKIKPAMLEKHLVKVHRNARMLKGQTLNLEMTEKVDQPSRLKKAANPHQLANLVNCPLCKQLTEYNALLVHIQVNHTHVDSKIVMSKFKRAYKSNQPGEKQKHEEELNEILKYYEERKKGG